MARCFCEELHKSGLKLLGQWHGKSYLSLLGWQVSIAQVVHNLAFFCTVIIRTPGCIQPWPWKHWPRNLISLFNYIAIMVIIIIIKMTMTHGTHLRHMMSWVLRRLRLDRSTARYIYKAKNGILLVVLTPWQKTKLIFEQYIQTLFDKDLC